jgi:hypothetical protein
LAYTNDKARIKIRYVDLILIATPLRGFVFLKILQQPPKEFNTNYQSTGNIPGALE